MPQHHPRLTAQCQLPSPLGPLLATATEQGLAGLFFDAQAHHPGATDVPDKPSHPVLRAAAQALAAYFDGEPEPLRLVALDLHGTVFQQAVWRALQSLARGATSSYGQIAAQAGSPAAVRAAGAAIGRNPVGILVPCHRVLGRDGSLTGYAGGLHRKQALLQLEGLLLL